MLNMSSVEPESDLTAAALIRNTALRLFAARGFDAVTVREIASEAGVSPALVLHHFGSKDGLRGAVDAYASQAFDTVIEGFDATDLAAMMTGGNPGSLAEAFARSFPAGSPLPAYLRRLFLTNDPAGAALFGRWFRLTEQLLAAMESIGLVQPSADPHVRAAFLLVNDLSLVLLRNQIATVLGVDPLTADGVQRWGAEAAAVYTTGVFRAQTEE